jgi:hypothetical protein
MWFFFFFWYFSECAGIQRLLFVKRHERNPTALTLLNGWPLFLNGNTYFEGKAKSAILPCVVSRKPRGNLGNSDTNKKKRESTPKRVMLWVGQRSRQQRLPAESVNRLILGGSAGPSFSFHNFVQNSWHA